MSSFTEDSAIHGEDDRKRALAEKYGAERAKRLNPQGNEQYIAIEGAFAQFAADPNVDAPLNRAPVTKSVDVMMVGGGITGLLTCVELRRAGIDNFAIVEKGSDFGGTWYWNRYPGIMCDCESLIYLPLLEEVGTIPTQKYVPGSEIHAHLRDIGKQFDLSDRSFFQTQVTDIRWSDEQAQQKWDETIARLSTFNAEASRNCTPGAYNNENTADGKSPSVFATAFGGGPSSTARSSNSGDPMQ